jgi:hypothetical protein
MTDEEIKEKVALSYFGGMLDSGGTIGVILVGKNKKEVPIVRIRRGHEYALEVIRKKWGGSVIKRGEAFEITVSYGKAVKFLRAIRNNTIARQKEIDVFLATWEKLFEQNG